MSKSLLFSLLIISTLAQAARVEFCVIDEEGNFHILEKHNVSSFLRTIPEDKIQKAFQYIAPKIAKTENGEYTLDGYIPGLGGGVGGANVGLGLVDLPLASWVTEPFLSYLLALAQLPRQLLQL